MMAETVVIVQARMGSTRLPGKILLPLGGQTALAQCLRRCQAIPGIDAVVCAVPEGEHDDAVAAEAQRCGVLVVRGSGADVLARYHKAAQQVGARWVVRVTSDCPLIDPVICGQVLATLKTQDLDFVCNNLPPSWPHGLDVEAFTFAALDQAFHAATDPFEREHVTPWIRNNPQIRKGNVARSGRSLAEICRWTLDFPEDYEFLSAMFDLLPPSPAIPDLRTVMTVTAEHPYLTEINAIHHGVRAVPKPKSCVSA